MSKLSESTILQSQSNYDCNNQLIAECICSFIAGYRVQKKSRIMYCSEKMDWIMYKLSKKYCNPLIDYIYLLGYDMPVLSYRSNFGAIKGISRYLQGKVLYNPELQIMYDMREREYKYRYGVDIDFMFLDGTLWTHLKSCKSEIERLVRVLLERQGFSLPKLNQQHTYSERLGGEEMLTYIRYLIDVYEKNLAISNDVWSDEIILQ